MKAQAVGAIALSLVLAACNSQPAPSEANAAAPVPTAPAPNAAPVVTNMQPAPQGLPSRIAGEVIKTSGQKCDAVTKAERDVNDGTIHATCAGGESYRVYTDNVKGPTALAL